MVRVMGSMQFVRADARIEALYDLEHTVAGSLLRKAEYPWEVLKDIGSFILEIGKTLSPREYDRPAENVWISKDVQIAPNASVGGAAIIGSGTQLRSGAFLRGNVIIGKNSVIGNSTELKNCILFDGVQVPHFNYIGDSVLGYKAHMGAGAIISNVKSDRSFPVIRCSDGDILTNLRKCGAFVGDFAEIGCGSILNPGTVIGRGGIVYPLSSVRGSIPRNCILKGERGIVARC
jgi:NDP-sugar pyrophosphorylase family protein